MVNEFKVEEFRSHGSESSIGSRAHECTIFTSAAPAPLPCILPTCLDHGTSAVSGFRGFGGAGFVCQGLKSSAQGRRPQVLERYGASANRFRT